MRRIGWLFVLIYFPGLSQSLHSGTDSLPPTGSYESPVRFRTLSVRDGLSQSSVVAAVQDQTGFWWLATQDGLNRFDGRQFRYEEKYFSDVTRPDHSRLGRLYVDQDASLWIVPASGVPERRNPATGQYTAYPFLHSVSCLTQDAQGQYWAATYGKGVLRFHPAKGVLERFFVPGEGYQFLHARDRTLWLAGSSGIYRYSPQNHSWEIISKTGAQIRFSSLAQTPDGTLWAGTHSQGLYCKGPADTSFLLFRGYIGQTALPADLYVLALRTDRQGHVWIGTYGRGLLRIDPERRVIREWLASRTDPNALAYNDVLTIYEDQNGVIGVGTDGGGISFYDPNMLYFDGFTANQVPAGIEVEQVRSLCADAQGRIWLGTSGKGLTRFDPATFAWHTYRHEPGQAFSLSNNRVLSLLADPEGLWIGTQGGGLCRFDAASGRFRTPSAFPDPTVWCLLGDRQQRYWAGTQNAGLVAFDPSGRMLQSYAFPSGIKTMVEDDRGGIWLGTESGGLHRFEIGTGSFQRIVFPTDHVIKSLYYDGRQQLWVGTQGGGLYALDTRSGGLRHFTTHDGLPNNVVYGILPGEKGSLWLSLNRGLCRVIEQPSGQLELKAFTPDEGLQSMEFNTGAYHRGSDGTLYFGGIAGFNFFRPELMSHRFAFPRVVITSIEVNGEPLNTSSPPDRADKVPATDTLPEARRLLPLNYDQNTLSFTVAALQFTWPVSHTFRYRLDNYDRQWNQAGTRNYFRYTNLPPGQYVLRVQAAGHNERWSQSEARLVIRIQPPLWQQSWFIGLVVLGVSGLLYGLYRYRINQLLRLHQVRNRLSADLHDEIGTSLSSISIMGALVHNSLPPAHPSMPFLERILEEAGQMSSSLDDIVWSINPKNDALTSLIARMTRYASELLEAKGIGYDILLPESPEEIRLSMEQRRELYLIFKEALTNLIKYAACSQACLVIALRHNELQLVVKDNGVGFDPALQNERNGLRNLRKRAESLGGILRIDSSPGKGTQVELNFPLKT